MQGEFPKVLTESIIEHVFKFCQNSFTAGSIPDLGWEQSGREIMPEVAGTVYQFLKKRKAGTGPAPTGADGGILLARHLALATLLGKNEQGGETGRGVAGAQPLHKGGPKARTPKDEERVKRRAK